MDAADLEARGGEGPLHHVVLAAAALAGHEQVAQVMGGQRLTHGSDGTRAGGVRMGHLRRWDADVPLEVAEQELGAGLSTIDADDAAMLGAHLLDAGVDDAARLLQEVRRTGPRPFAGAAGYPRDYLQEQGQG